MTNIALLQSLGLFDARVPRYTSYPAAPVFSGAVGANFQAQAIEALDPAVPISVYVHVPFCERLCWFCACRTQGTQTLAPVEAYVGTLLQELELVKQHLPAGVKAGRLHWGGGTPTILSPELIHKLAQAIKAVIPFAEDYEFSVEIDPMMVDEPKIRALSEEGMNRASIGIQDFTDIVQNAIGREQPFENTKACVETLRRYGVHSLNTDLVYGLPHQNRESLAATIDKVLSLRPDRVAIFGYAHVPWMAKRQKLIDETVLPPTSSGTSWPIWRRGSSPKAGSSASGSTISRCPTTAWRWLPAAESCAATSRATPTTPARRFWASAPRRSRSSSRAICRTRPPPPPISSRSRRGGCPATGATA